MGTEASGISVTVIASAKWVKNSVGAITNAMWSQAQPFETW